MQRLNVFAAGCGWWKAIVPDEGTQEIVPHWNVQMCQSSGRKTSQEFLHTMKKRMEQLNLLCHRNFQREASSDQRVQLYGGEGVHCHHPAAHLHPFLRSLTLEYQQRPLLIGSFIVGHSHSQEATCLLFPASATNQQGCWFAFQQNILVPSFAAWENPPWILSGSFRDRKMQEEFAATQAEMQRPGLPVTVVGVCHGPCDLSPSKIPRFQRRYPSAILSCFCKYCNWAL